MTEKGKRRLVIASAVVVGAVGLFAWGVYALTSEHPDYVRAANGLARARAESEARYGSLDLHAYRREHGIIEQDDSVAWKAIRRSIPEALWRHWEAGSTNTDYQFSYVQEKQWLLDLKKRIEPLIVQSFSQGQTYADYSDVKELTRMCYVGLIGASDAGDTEAVLVIGHTCNILLSKLLDDPHVISVLVASSLRMITQQGILTAAVRNRHKRSILEALATVMSEAPRDPPMRDQIAGELRTSLALMSSLRGTPVERLDRELNAWMGDHYIEDPTGIDALLANLWDKVTKQEAGLHRRVGPNTVDALEARLLETQMALEDAHATAVSDYRTGFIRIERLAADVERRKDRSYELSFPSSLTSSLFLSAQEALRRQLSQACFRIIEMYPYLEEVPQVLPPELRARDPYTGRDAVFVKTPTGFVIYSLGANQRDEAVPSSTPARNAKTSKFIKLSPTGDDWGYFVEY